MTRPSPRTRRRTGRRRCARAQHEGAFLPFEQLAAIVKWEDMGYHAHSQSWSRVDYLMQADEEKLGAMLKQLKSVPPDGTYEAQGAQICALAQKLLAELYGLDPAGFDQKWREWVLKTYPKK